MRRDIGYKDVVGIYVLLTPWGGFGVYFISTNGEILSCHFVNANTFKRQREESSIGSIKRNKYC